MLFKKTIICLISAIYIIFNNKSNKPRTLLARVNKNLLYKDDIKNIFNEDMTEIDKKDILSKTINDWVEKQLIIAEAQKQKNYNEIEIQHRLLEYKYALIIHDFLEKQVAKQLNNEVSKKEITTYYEENLNNFELKDNIVKGKFIVIPKNSPNRIKFEKLFLSEKEDAIEKLKEYCEQNAIKYNLNTSKWYKFDDIIYDTPLQFSRDKLTILKRIKRTRMYKVVGKSDNIIYYFNIKDFKILNQISPIEFVKEQIKATIIHKRKIELQKRLAKNILENAKNRGDYEIYFN